MYSTILVCAFAYLDSFSRLAEASPAFSVNAPRDAGNGCSLLAAKFPNKVFLPGNARYTNESTQLWSETCLLPPSCVFTPSNAFDVSAALKIIKRTQTNFAVRGGGHMPVPGAASTDSGVMIATTNLNTNKFVQGTSAVQIGPGQTWGQVYNFTSQQGLAVAGGRYGQVGVGGLLIGGGIGYFGNRVGWGMNNVFQYEVVLADGTICLVNKNNHADLFWALKGGNNNFGIVTRFDMTTIPITSAYVGGAVWPKPALPPFFDALTAFLRTGGAFDDPYTAINPAVITTPFDGTLECSNIVFHQGDDPAPATLANFSVIPNPIFNDIGVRPSWKSLPDELNQPAFAARSSRELFWSSAIKPTREALSLANTTIITAALEQLQGVANGTITLAYQPISKSWLQAARRSGGDAIDLDPADGGFVSVLVTYVWENASDDALIRKFSRTQGDLLNQKAKAAGLYYPFIYVNDASPGQNPYPLYGKGKSLPRLRAIRQKYDPTGFFQKYLASGFKLGGN